MMPFNPFIRFPNYCRPNPYYYPQNKTHKNNHSYNKNNAQNTYNSNYADINNFKDISDSYIPNILNTIPDSNNNSEQYFEILGLKLYFDDLLIIALLIFLYQENVKDNYLYIALILLLLS